MPTLQLTSKEAELLNSIFASVADLDLYEHFDCEFCHDNNLNKVNNKKGNYSIKSIPRMQVHKSYL